MSPHDRDQAFVDRLRADLETPPLDARRFDAALQARVRRVDRRPLVWGAALATASLVALMWWAAPREPRIAQAPVATAQVDWVSPLLGWGDDAGAASDDLDGEEAPLLLALADPAGGEDLEPWGLPDDFALLDTLIEPELSGDL